MIEFVLRAARSADPDQIVVVLSPAKASIAETLAADCDVAWQHDQLGTGHAAAQAMPLLRPEIRTVANLFGDHPLLTDEAVRGLFDASARSGALVTLLTAKLEDPAAYGRLVRQDGRIVGVVEAKDDHTRYEGPVEVNSGISAYRREWLEHELPSLPRSQGGEYYLTALVERAASVSDVGTPVVSIVAPAEVAYGVNDRYELSVAESEIRRRVNQRLMRSGVAIVDPGSTFIDDTVSIGQDARIEPFTTITGQTEIADLCRIGPQAIVRDSTIGEASEIVASTVEGAEIGARVHVGPYSHFRPGTRIGDDAHIGNYVEVKNSTVGPATHIGHFSYVGDADLGRRVNIGAGTITANFDGVAKHRTVIGDDAFIGSDTILRAPVEIGPRGRTGAGSVVTRDVAPDATVVGIPARPIRRTTSADDRSPSES
jgi:bifunctional UDP-N-acetylglucosamine pyrophosphorylase/glucosamine-1-phosphate N-acetyltransferase